MNQKLIQSVSYMQQAMKPAQHTKATALNKTVHCIFPTNITAFPF